VRPLPFLALYLTLLGALLSAQQALLRLVPDPTVAPKAEVDSSEGVMALPPKPDGLAPAAANGTGDGPARLSESACAGMAPSVQDVCWQALARQDAPRDPDGALTVCARVKDPELALECRADVAETISPVDRVKAESICDTIDSIKWRGQCHFGIGLALADRDSAYALSQCQHAEAFKLFCRHDVVGTVALTDLPAAVAFCAQEEGEDLQRKTCWHGIGKYIARRDLHEAAAACDQGTPVWRGNCYHGLGWGAAERDPDAALAGCATLGGYADNCRQGVAHELKRADPERAVALCKAIATDSIRERCLTFVTR